MLDYHVLRNGNRPKKLKPTGGWPSGPHFASFLVIDYVWFAPQSGRKDFIPGSRVANTSRLLSEL
jgi:hypothetical protein